MSRDYAKVSPNFWTGATGKAIRKAGRDAQVLALYLITSPHANMIGLYHLPLAYVVNDTSIPLQGASKALQRIIDAGFCRYDERSECVWVVEMARFQIEGHLDVKDNRVKGIRKDYANLPNNAFLKEFFDKYAAAFHLEEQRGLEGPYKGPPKALRSQELEQEHEQEQKQEQEQEQRARKRAVSPKVALPADFGISERIRLLAASRGATRLDERLEHFVGYVTANGKTYADWDAAFWNAIRDDWAKLGKINGNDAAFAEAERRIFGQGERDITDETERL